MTSESKPFLSTSSDTFNIEDDDASPPYYKSPSTIGWKRAYIQLTITCLLSVILGFFLGHSSVNIISSRSYYGGLLGTNPSITPIILPLIFVSAAPEGDIIQVWAHNLTFSQAPTPQSEAAWNSLIPVGRGFIHQHEIAPFISNIAVFHQLHCLHAILTAHYASQDRLARVLNGENVNEPQELYGARIESDHIRHCFDYLRRSVMCAADTNLEVVSRENHTTNGWGQEKKCRDYKSVVEYAELWANSTDTGIVPGAPPNGHNI